MDQSERNELEEYIRLALDDFGLPELDELCRHEWLLRLILMYCEGREDARFPVHTGPDGQPVGV